MLSLRDRKNMDHYGDQVDQQRGSRSQLQGTEGRAKEPEDRTKRSRREVKGSA